MLVHHPEMKNPDTRKAATGLVRLTHVISHLDKTSLQGLSQKHLAIAQLTTLTQLVSKTCLCCAQHNPGQGPKPPLLVQKKGLPTPTPKNRLH
jgi:hypothetical protein